MHEERKRSRLLHNIYVHSRLSSIFYKQITKKFCNPFNNPPYVPCKLDMPHVLIGNTLFVVLCLKVKMKVYRPEGINKPSVRLLHTEEHENTFRTVL